MSKEPNTSLKEQADTLLAQIENAFSLIDDPDEALYLKAKLEEGLRVSAERLMDRQLKKIEDQMVECAIKAADAGMSLEEYEQRMRAEVEKVMGRLKEAEAQKQTGAS